DAGLLLPFVRTRANSAAFDAQYQLSRRWLTAVDFRHDLVGFDSPTLVDGSGMAGRASLERALSRSDVGAVSGEWQHGSAHGTGADIQTARAAWRTDRRAFRIELGGGAMRVQAFGSSHAVTTTAFDAGVSRSVHGGSLFVRATRSADPGYGLGR